MAAVKAALAEGVVPGGGVTLVNLATSYTHAGDADASVSAGEDLPIHALEQPFRILLTNSGLNADECLPQVRAAWPGFGINVNIPGELIDLKAAGVVDPVRVETLQNAASIAGTAMTTGALVVDLPEKEAASLLVASTVPGCRGCWPT
jgi:60 kDa chaperonin